MNTLYGLVVCGGVSSRMGTDKSLLDYYGKPHRYFVYEMLQEFCSSTFISCNAHQAGSAYPEYEVIIDLEKYRDTGPMAALLSSFDRFPNASFLVAGCDYPFLEKNDIRKLTEERSPDHLAVYYFNEPANAEEPLLAVYEKECYPYLKTNFDRKKYSLRHFLKEEKTHMVLPESTHSLFNVNTPAEYDLALTNIKRTCLK
jgi:molybdopterin-guanine dinucleotide biosynthesis protein A